MRLIRIFYSLNAIFLLFSLYLCLTQNNELKHAKKQNFRIIIELEKSENYCDNDNMDVCKFIPDFQSLF